MRQFQQESSVGWLKAISALWHRWIIAVAVVFIAAAPAYAASPWEDAVDILERAFTGPSARGLALVAIVTGGLTYAFDEGGSKHRFAGILFGVAMAVGAVNFFHWLFG